MGKGRKPTPRGIRDLRGNPGRRKATGREPEPKPMVPVCPEHLSDEAKREWARIVPELMACGVLAAVDRAALAGYCESWALWIRAKKIMADPQGGLTTFTAKGGLKRHPAVGIANEALTQMRSFAAEFGMTPSSRSRISIAGEGKGDSLEVFIGQTAEGA